VDNETRNLDIDLPLAYWGLLEGCADANRGKRVGELISCILMDYLEPIADTSIEYYEDLKVIRNGGKK